MNNYKNIQSAIEALLFTSSSEIKTEKLSQILDVDIKTVEDALNGLKQDYKNRGAGIVLKKIAGGWRLFSSPEYHDLIERYTLSQDTRKLSRASLETLAIIAYMQPVTKNSIAQARGVNSDYCVNSLIEKGLVKESYRVKDNKKSYVYLTTNIFLEYFGLNDLDDLPDLESFAPDVKTKKLISEKLNRSKVDTSLTEDIDKTDNDSNMLFDNAISSAFGVTDKIDFNKLEIDTDNE